jgi:hypothetical protein
MDYSKFKIVTNPRADRLSDQLHTFSDSEIQFNEAENTLYVDELNSGTTTYSFGNPDYNYDQFLSNLVARYEFRPGCIIYLVWSQTRDYYDTTGSFSLDQNINNLYTSKKPHDVFLLKFTYRFGLH